MISERFVSCTCTILLMCCGMWEGRLFTGRAGERVTPSSRYRRRSATSWPGPRLLSPRYARRPPPSAAAPTTTTILSYYNLLSSIATTKLLIVIECIVIAMPALYPFPRPGTTPSLLAFDIKMISFYFQRKSREKQKSQLQK